MKPLVGHLATLSLVLLGLGCDADPYCFNCSLDATVRNEGVTPLEIQAVDAIVRDRASTDLLSEVMDVPSDSCVGVDVVSDPHNCGACGRVCAPAHAFASCAMGRCGVSGCDVGFYDLNRDAEDGCEYACTPIPGVTDDRTCDLRDDDCDGAADEDVNLCNDTRHCGMCGRECHYPHAAASCSRSDGMTTGACTVSNTRCEMGACEAGFFDRNRDATDGCEYECRATGAEVCDGLDNDCDGMIDDANPGGGAACGMTRGACRMGTTLCDTGALRCVGSVEASPELCNNVDDDCNGTADDGDLLGDARLRIPCGSGTGDCRQGTSQCTGGAVVCVGASGASAEVCDGRDNDCDGAVDNGVPSAGPCGRSVGICRAGLLQCVGGRTACVGGTEARSETCNGMDDDCDGTADNGFDLTRDPINCGVCGVSCVGRIPNAVAACTAGACQIVACRMGFFDDITSPTPDCNYACNVSSPTEICNGVDDNCNGQVDESVSIPAGFCRSAGPCAGATARCSGRSGLACNYPAGVDVDPSTGQPPAVETRCDGVDNNCNGAVDEGFATLGQSCGAGVGACATSGQVVCNAAGNGTRCNAAAAGSPAAERCDGIDNDCDGSIDENGASPGGNPSFVTSAWASVSGAGASTLWVMQYEASRPGASATSQGIATTRACSAPNVIPWTNLRAQQASDACAAAGARLCTEAQWTLACRSSTNTCRWSYGSACTGYSSVACNGYDYDIDPGPAVASGLVPTGSLGTCFADFRATRSAPNQIFDMSGNAKEFTLERSPGVIPLRGGAYNNIAGGTECTFDWTVVDNDFAFNNAGFRCCFTGATPP